MLRFWVAGSCLLGLLVINGCGGESAPPLAQVEGTVKDTDGNVLDGIKVMFLPDPESGVLGSPGIGETDASGKFVLYYNGDKNQPGTAIGLSFVIMEDITSIRSSRDEEPIPRRFHRRYTASNSTDLKLTVKDEENQSFDIVVDPSDE
ncbi:MAG: hypothetical protein ACR2NP_08315 [Pirellulaceae bacterium]